MDRSAAIPLRALRWFCAGSVLVLTFLAGAKYLADGRDPASLTPLAVQKLGLLPPNWVNDPDVATHNGLWLVPRDGGLIGVGVVGS